MKLVLAGTNTMLLSHMELKAMMFYLRHGVYLLSLLVLVLALAAGWLWRTLYWQQGYLALQPLPASNLEDQSAWQWPDLSAAVLQQQLMQLFVAVGSELQVQIAADEVSLQVLLPAPALPVLEQLPVWPGWQLAVMELLPKGAWWSLHLRLRRSESATVVSAPDNLVSAMNVDEALWQLAQVKPESSNTHGSELQVAGPAELNWQLASIWSLGERRGIWLRAEDGVLHSLERGAVWHGFELFEVDADGVSWRSPMGSLYRQVLCGPLFVCGGEL